MRAAPVALLGSAGVSMQFGACRERDFGADFRIRGEDALTGLPATTGWQRVFFGTKTPAKI